ncbi:MAG: 50S ribosomal protein L29 [Pseudomonadales bacterium]|nr:50S ribosomal protein L29 [Pseudomonadales bacterium]
MKVSELREKSSPELEQSLLGLREEQFKSKMQHASGQLNTNHQIKQIRRDIARVKTVLRQKVGEE